jgi:hypothetical protein
MRSSVLRFVRVSAVACLTGLTLALTSVSDSHGRTNQGSAPAEFQGAGRLVLPADSPQVMRDYAFGCTGCMWRFTSPCNVVFGLGNRECEVRDSLCSRGQLLRIWVLAPAQSWKDFGVSCIPQTGLVYVRTMQTQALRYLDESLPELSFDCAPKSGIVENLPFLCRSSAGFGLISRQWEVQGIPIRIDLQPRLTWWVGEGSPPRLNALARTQTVPVWSHVFSYRGRHQVSHQVSWTPTMHLSGLSGEVELPQVVQRAHLKVSVGTMSPVLAASGE